MFHSNLICWLVLNLLVFDAWSHHEILSYEHMILRSIFSCRTKRRGVWGCSFQGGLDIFIFFSLINFVFIPIMLFDSISLLQYVFQVFWPALRFFLALFLSAFCLTVVRTDFALPRNYDAINFCFWSKFQVNISISN